MSKRIFLLEQPILQLADWVRDADHQLRKSIVCGEGNPREKASDKSVDRQEPWLKEDQRFNILQKAQKGDPDWRRVAIVCDAGLGKTTTLQYYQAHILQEEKRIPFILQLPMASAGKGKSDPHLIPLDNVDEALLLYLARQAQSRGVKGSIPYLQSWLVSLRKESRLLLFLDGLDQALSQQDNLLVSHLSSLLLHDNAWSSCPIWCAGRPAAFRDSWNDLFASSAWQFVKVGALPEQAIRRAMLYEAGVDFLEAFPPGAHHLLATPRYLELIWPIVRKPLAKLVKEPQVESVSTDTLRPLLAHLQSVADVYHHACFTQGSTPKNFLQENLNDRGLLGQGLSGPAAIVGQWIWGDPPHNYEERLRYVADFLGALAFTMAVEYPKTPFSAMVPASEVRHIKQSAFQHFRQADSYRACTEADFSIDFKLISEEMNIGTLDHLILAEEGSHGLKWHDRTMATFFAAYWLMNHGSPADQKHASAWITNSDSERDDFFDEFWEIAAALPEVNRQKWLEIVRRCYAAPPHTGKQRDWIEWSRRVLHHSWQCMQQRAPEVVAEYQSSFQRLKQGNAKEKRIYREITGELVTIPAGKCPFGYETGGVEVSWIPVTSFQLHRWAVCNEWYEAFEPEHRQERWITFDEKAWIRRFGKKAMERCPVNRVNWYDAWAFAHWCGLQLPSELQWEYACRLGSSTGELQTAFYWGNFCDGSECNCKGIYQLNHHAVVPVDFAEQLGNAQHRLGLAHLSGNVWEWTDSMSLNNWRVLRGGSWFYNAWYCRSANRDRYEPADLDFSTGFRLARTV